MAHQVAWNTIILEEFVRIGCLTKDEEDVLRTRVKGWSRVEQAMKLGMSVSKVDVITKRLKIKYDNAAMYSDILPKREFSASATYAAK